MMPDCDKLRHEILSVLSKTSSTTFRELRSDLENAFNLSPEERTKRTASDAELLMSSLMHRELESLVRDGLVIKLTRSDWQLTESGREAVKARRDG